MEIKFTPTAEQDLLYWKKGNNPKLLERIRDLLESIQASPFTGIGKPEALKYQLSGKWSRRIDKGNRIVYEVRSNFVVIHSLKGHYDK
jgi:toxin YoeB